MKAYFYLAQAQLALHHPNEALNSALTAYDLCINANSSSTRNVSELVLRAKKEKWELKEKNRLRTRNAMLRELEELLEASRAEELTEVDANLNAGEITATEAAEEKLGIEDIARRKVEELRSLFATADPMNSQQRVRCSHRNCLSDQEADRNVGGSRLSRGWYLILRHA